MKWIRSSQGKIAGVCQGLAQGFDTEPWKIRTLWVLLTLLGGSGILVYFFCYLSFPRADKLTEGVKSKVLGVCLRLSQKMDIEIGLVRFLALSLLTLSLGTVFILYLAMHFILDGKEVKS